MESKITAFYKSDWLISKVSVVFLDNLPRIYSNEN